MQLQRGATRRFGSRASKPTGCYDLCCWRCSEGRKGTCSNQKEAGSVRGFVEVESEKEAYHGRTKGGVILLWNGTDVSIVGNCVCWIPTVLRRPSALQRLDPVFAGSRHRRMWSRMEGTMSGGRKDPSKPSSHDTAAEDFGHSGNDDATQAGPRKYCERYGLIENQPRVTRYPERFPTPRSLPEELLHCPDQSVTVPCHTYNMSLVTLST